jgi:hypothetical protein
MTHQYADQARAYISPTLRVILFYDGCEGLVHFLMAMTYVFGYVMTCAKMLCTSRFSSI